jgi:hypothetical protein
MNSSLQKVFGEMITKFAYNRVNYLSSQSCLLP